MKKKIIFIGAVVVIGIASVFFMWKSDDVSHNVIETKRGDLIQEVLVSGTVEPMARVDLQFKNSGAISEIATEVGRAVKKGDIVARQSASVLAGQQEQSEAELINQEYKLKLIVKDQTEKTDEEKYLIKSQKALVEKARADVRTQKMKIEETELVSPIDGIVSSITSDVGEIAKPETSVVSIISVGMPHIEINIPETTIANVRVGQAARIMLDAFGDDVYWLGVVSDIDPAENNKGGAVYYKATVRFESEDARVKPGMSANVWIRTGIAENALSVPIGAIRKVDDKNSVFVMNDQLIVEKEVSVGLKGEAGMIEILSGIAEGDRVVLDIEY